MTLNYRAINGERRAIDTYEGDVAINQLFCYAVQHHMMMCKHNEFHVGIFRQHLHVFLHRTKLKHDTTRSYAQHCRTKLCSDFAKFSCPDSIFHIKSIFTVIFHCSFCEMPTKLITRTIKEYCFFLSAKSKLNFSKSRCALIFIGTSTTSTTFITIHFVLPLLK